MFSDEQIKKLYPFKFVVDGTELNGSGCFVTLEKDGFYYTGRIDTSFQHGKCYMPHKGSKLLAHTVDAKWDRPGAWILIPFVDDKGQVEELKVRIIRQYQ